MANPVGFANMERGDESDSSGSDGERFSESEPDNADVEEPEPEPEMLDEGTNHPALIIAPNRTVNFQLWSKDDVIGWAKLVIPGRMGAPTIRFLRNMEKFDGERLRDLATDETIFERASSYTRRLRDHAAKLINEYNRQRIQRRRDYRRVVFNQREEIGEEQQVHFRAGHEFRILRRRRRGILDQYDPVGMRRVRAAFLADADRRARQRLEAMAPQGRHNVEAEVGIMPLAERERIIVRAHRRRHRQQAREQGIEFDGASDEDDDERMRHNGFRGWMEGPYILLDSDDDDEVRDVPARPIQDQVEEREQQNDLDAQEAVIEVPARPEERPELLGNAIRRAQQFHARLQLAELEEHRQRAAQRVNDLAAQLPPNVLQVLRDLNRPQQAQQVQPVQEAPPRPLEQLVAPQLQPAPRNPPIAPGPLGELLERIRGDLNDPHRFNEMNAAVRRNINQAGPGPQPPQQPQEPQAPLLLPPPQAVLRRDGLHLEAEMLQNVLDHANRNVERGFPANHGIGFILDQLPVAPRAPAEPPPAAPVPEEALRQQLGYNDIPGDPLLQQLAAVNFQHPPLAVPREEAERIFRAELADRLARRLRRRPIAEEDREDQERVFEERALRRLEAVRAARARAEAFDAFRQRIVHDDFQLTPENEQRAQDYARMDVVIRANDRIIMGLPFWNDQEKEEAYLQYLQRYRANYRQEELMAGPPPVREERPELMEVQDPLPPQNPDNNERAPYDEGPNQPEPLGAALNYRRWRPDQVTAWIRQVGPINDDTLNFINLVRDHGGALIEEIAMEPRFQELFQLPDDLYGRLKDHAVRVVNHYWAQRQHPRNAPVPPREPNWWDDGGVELILPEGMSIIITRWMPEQVVTWITAVCHQDDNQELIDRIRNEELKGETLLRMRDHEQECRDILQIPPEKFDRIRYHVAKVHNEYMREVYQLNMNIFRDAMAVWRNFRNR